MVASLGVLAARHAPELSRPVDNRVIEHPACLEVIDEGSGGFLHLASQLAVVFGEVFLAVPVAARETVVGAAPDLEEADAAFEQMVGGKTDEIHGEPVRVKALHYGNYVETEVRHGGRRCKSMGHTAVIEAEGSTRGLPSLLLLTNPPTSPNSLHQLISNGVYPERQKILVAKGATAPRAAYEPIAARIVEVNSGGTADINPARFTFKHIRRPLFGIDP